MKYDVTYCSSGVRPYAFSLYRLVRSFPIASEVTMFRIYIAKELYINEFSGSAIYRHFCTYLKITESYFRV